MELFELAGELGKKIKEDGRMQALERAKTAYETDPALQRYRTEYDVQQAAMQAEVAKPDRDLHLIDALQARADELYRLIAEHPAFIELNRAQAEANDLMNQVNAVITAAVTGQEPTSCTHDCRTCKGCH